MIRCPTCSTENVDGARFCANCGSTLGEACANCGTAIPAGARFCPACGTPVEPLGPPGQERKLVTILFADVTGSTGLGERLDPERLRDVMDSYFEAMRGEIEAEGGTVEKFMHPARKRKRPAVFAMLWRFSRSSARSVSAIEPAT